MKICIVIPVLNEAKTIGGIVLALRKKSLDVVVIDDGSSDDSGPLAEDNGAHILQHPERQGKGYSLREGFNYALHADYHGVISMDGDGQHDVNDVEQFIEGAKKAPDQIIVGNRMTKREEMPGIRYWTNKAMSTLISMACRQKIPDTQSGFRYIPMSFLKSADLSCSGYEIESEILMKASKQGIAVKSIPIRTIYDTEESHIHPVKDTVRFLSFFIKEIFSKKT